MANGSSIKKYDKSEKTNQLTCQPNKEKSMPLPQNKIPAAVMAKTVDKVSAHKSFDQSARTKQGKYHK